MAKISKPQTPTPKAIQIDTIYTEASRKEAIGARPPLSDNARGALWMIAAALAATAMTIAVRLLADGLDTRMMAFLRTALGIFVLAPWLFDGGIAQFRLSKPWLHVLRGALMAIALNLGFFAISELPMATVTILFFLAPVFATALAGPILLENVGPRRWAAVLAGFCGAVIVLRPGFGAFEWAMLAAICSSACYSIALLLSKIIAPVDGARSVVLTSTAIAALACFPVAVPVWTLPTSGFAWIMLAVLIAASTARLYADVRAYTVGEAGFIAPFSYLRLVFVAIAGWLLFSETLDAWAFAGGAVIIGSTLYIARREAQIGKRIAGGAA